MSDPIVCPPLMAGVPGADDLLGAGSSRKFLQKVVGQIQSPEVDQTPGDHRGQGRQAVRGQVQVGGPGQDVHEPVQFQPGQLQTAPTHTHSLSTDRHQPQEHMKVLCVWCVCDVTGPSLTSFTVLSGVSSTLSLRRRWLKSGWSIRV